MSPTYRSRFQPLLRERHRIGRPRLLGRLSGRFDDRLTLIHAPAGSGKSALLAQAIANNELDPIGHDVLVAATANDAEPSMLLGMLAEAFGLEVGPSHDWRDAILRVCDSVWSLAPTEVAIIVDDAHHLVGTEPVEALSELLSALPANGHLVLAGRVLPAVPSTRLAASGEVTRVEPDELLLDSDEISRLAELRGVAGDVGDLPTLPALADLQLTLGVSASSQYLWEEVLAKLDPARLDGLLRSAVPETLTDGLVRHLTEGAWDAASLLAELPMVDVNSEGRWRMHGLLRSALAERSEKRGAMDAADAAGRYLLAEGDLVGATALLAEADRWEEVMDLLRYFARQPQMAISQAEYRVLVGVASRVGPGSVIHDLIEAQASYHSYSREQIDRFSEVARRARNKGEPELEAICIFRVVQGLEQYAEPIPEDLAQRMRLLAPGDSFATAVDAHMASATVIPQGDAAGARFLERYFAGFPPLTRKVITAERLCQIGHYDSVGIDATIEEIGDTPEGVEFYQALAIWVRGELLPELAFELVSGMARQTDIRAPRYASVSNYAVGVMVALAAGERRVAGEWAALASRDRVDTLAPGIRAFPQLAEAMVAAYDGDDQALRSLDVTMPSGRWVWMASFVALPALYSRQPALRSMLDAAEFEPTMAKVLGFGQALVELTEAGSALGAVELPWRETALLRNHVIPPDLVRLASAAAEQGSHDAAELLEEIPDLRRWLAQVAAEDKLPGSNWAKERLLTLPARPPGHVRLQVLGTPLVGWDEVAGWKRARVRELLACLIEFRSADRSTVASTIWPDLPQDKALSNLRVNLVHLARALGVEDDPTKRVVESEGSMLRLGDWVEVDLDRFDETLAEAQQMESRGLPAEALDRYREALVPVRGAYMEGIDCSWLESTRARVNAAVLGARCRVGELLLARAEPEQAMTWVVEARRISPLDERAGRLMVACLAASGDRIGAAAFGDRLCVELGEAGFEPEPQTVKVLQRLRGKPAADVK